MTRQEQEQEREQEQDGVDVDVSVSVDPSVEAGTQLPPNGAQRTLALQGAFNARDLGGYLTSEGAMTRWRMALRTANLFRLTDADVDLLHELGLRTVLDLRSPDEIGRTGTSSLFGRGVVRYQHYPFLGPDSQVWNAQAAADPAERRRIWRERGYEGMLDTAAPLLSPLFAVLADPDSYPLIFHCVAGKDRTGLLAALVLRTLGVPDDVIVADYALTAEHRPSRELLAQMLIDHGIPASEVEQRVDRVWQSPPEVMQSTLTVIDARYGSTAGLLEHLGIPDEHVAALREILLQPAE